MSVSKFRLIFVCCFAFFPVRKSDESPDTGPEQDPEIILIDSTKEITGGSFAIINVNVVPMTADQVLENHTLLIENNVISGLGIQGTITIPDG